MIKRGDDWMKRRLRLVSVFISCLLAFSSVGFLLNDNSVLAYSEDTKSGFEEQSLDEYDLIQRLLVVIVLIHFTIRETIIRRNTKMLIEVQLRMSGCSSIVNVLHLLRGV